MAHREARLSAAAGATGTVFREYRIAVGGQEVSYLEAGEGDPLLVLPAAGGPGPASALEQLAARRRVIVLGLAGAAPREAAGQAAT